MSEPKNKNQFSLAQPGVKKRFLISATMDQLNQWRRRIGVAPVLMFLLAAAHGQLVFTDNFDTGASSFWSNLRGDWFSTNGVYDASQPQNIPPTFTGLPFILQNLAIDVDINQVADGGIWLRCDASGTNGVLLVTGGHGWGAGDHGGNAGRSLYWHVITPANWSSPPILNEAFNVFTNPVLKMSICASKCWATFTPPL